MWFRHLHLRAGASVRLSLSLKATQPPFENKRFYMAWMYILQCSDDLYYVGSIKNLALRFLQHQSGKGSKYTSGRLPVTLVYCEEYDRVSDASYLEKQVQGWTRRRREALINGTPELLPTLAKKVFDKSKIKNNSVVE